MNKYSINDCPICNKPITDGQSRVFSSMRGFKYCHRKCLQGTTQPRTKWADGTRMCQWCVDNQATHCHYPDCDESDFPPQVIKNMSTEQKLAIGVIVSAVFSLLFVILYHFFKEPEPVADQVWHFESAGKDYDLTVRHVNGACSIVDMEGVIIAIPIDILHAVADPE